MAGLTSSGFETKTLETILSEIENDQREALGSDLDTSAEGVIGTLNGIVATKLRELWELAEVVYSARDPRNASLAALDAVSAITGTSRRAATKGRVTLSLTLGPGALVDAGSIVAAAGQPTNRWVTLAPAQNGTLTTATVTVVAEAQTAGRVTANAGTLTTIVTPKAGWTSVTNVSDAAPGKEIEEDPALRTRRESELQQAGSSPVDAVRAALEKVDGVQQAVVIQNDTDATLDGIPPHSVESIVIGGTDEDVGAALWKAKAAGIATHGNTSVSVLDASGRSQTVRFTRPTDKNLWVQAHISRTSAYAGDVALKNALVSLNNTLLAGDKALISDLIVLSRAVRGVSNARIRLGTSSGSFADSDIPVGKRQRARLDTARITVVLV